MILGNYCRAQWTKIERLLLARSFCCSLVYCIYAISYKSLLEYLGSFPFVRTRNSLNSMFICADLSEFCIFSPCIQSNLYHIRYLIYHIRYLIYYIRYILFILINKISYLLRYLICYIRYPMCQLRYLICFIRSFICEWRMLM